MTVDSAVPPSGSTPRRPSQLAYWLFGLVMIAAAVGWLLAHGADALRRPLVTPLVVGLVLGFVSHRLAPAGLSTVRRGSRLVAGLSAAGAIMLMHAEFLHRLQVTAAERARSDPQQAFALELSRQLLMTTESSETIQREQRLAVAPTWADYIVHRATPLLGNAAAPWPQLLLAGEVIFAAAAAGSVVHRLRSL